MAKGSGATRSVLNKGSYSPVSGDYVIYHRDGMDLKGFVLSSDSNQTVVLTKGATFNVDTSLKNKFDKATEDLSIFSKPSKIPTAAGTYQYEQPDKTIEVNIDKHLTSRITGTSSARKYKEGDTKITSIDRETGERKILYYSKRPNNDEEQKQSIKEYKAAFKKATGM